MPGKVEHRRHCDVDTRFMADGRGGHYFGFCARDAARPVHAVAAEVHHRAAAERRIVAEFAGHGTDRHVEVGIDVAHGADAAGADQFQHTRKQGMKTIVVRLDQDIARPFGRIDHRPRFAGIHRERFFAQHRLAGLQGGYRPARMAARRQAVVDEVHAVTRHQGRVILFDLRDPVFLRERCGTRRFTRRDRTDRDTLDRCRGFDERIAGNPRCTEKSYSNHLLRCPLILWVSVRQRRRTGTRVTRTCIAEAFRMHPQRTSIPPRHRQ